MWITAYRHTEEEKQINIEASKKNDSNNKNQ